MNMEIPDLSFQLNVNTDVSRGVFYTWFKEEWTDLGIDWTTNSTSYNWFQINKYHSDEFQFYVLVASKNNLSATQDDLDHQVDLVRTLISRLEDRGCTVEFNGEFEQLL